MSRDAGDTEYWLPEDFEVNFTALELGALVGILVELKSRSKVDFPVRVKGRDEPVQMVDRLLEKLDAAWRNRPIQGEE